MDLGSRRMPGDRPFALANVRAGDGVQQLAEFLKHSAGLRAGETTARVMQAQLPIQPGR